MGIHHTKGNGKEIAINAVDSRSRFDILRVTIRVLIIITENLCCVFSSDFIEPMQGPISLTIFPSQFKFDGNFI